ncbi:MULTISPECIES: HNH endonuclease signature motif containing protein [unclassified Mycobacterium]|uniref:HNH endonuclease signature motif containing protein n=1 Tax=unclassified Mycobacterium TaxID=2642494 RepID=UPI000A8DAA71|nr:MULTISPECIES: HNH endonuclease signature motif containing protein [unclassified Mycobacterium]
MFDKVDVAGLIATITEAARAEASAAALRSAAIGELVSRQVGDYDEDERARWACDPWDSVAAQIAAAVNISHRKASGQMRIAQTLRHRLPKAAALFEQGRLTARVIGAITWRTRLITDDDVWARIDTALVGRATTWGPWSDEKITAAVDALVERFDPAAVIATQSRLRGRDFIIGDFEDEAGTTTVRGRLTATDAAVWRAKTAAMVAGVCDNDPRTPAERRSDAAGALANGNDHLDCRCGSPTCPSADQPPPASSVVIHVVADQAAIDAATATTTETTRGSDTTPEPDKTTDTGTAILSGREVLPTALLAHLLRTGATLQPLATPCDEPETHYRPSAALARFVRARDLSCRFPGCTMPAQFCDIDHVIPYPAGPTHPSNLACLCRKHHLLKTFWTGDWALQLSPDGAATWTSPTGHTYTTHPGSRLWFPTWGVTTADLPRPGKAPPPQGDRGLRMPMRKRSRAAERAARIKQERAQNFQTYHRSDQPCSQNRNWLPNGSVTSMVRPHGSSSRPGRANE